MKRMMTGLVVLMFMFSSLMFLTSCAKKQVRVSDETQTKTEATKASEADEAAGRDIAAENEAYKAKKEAERQAMLREMRKRQEMKTALRHFQAEKIYFDFDKSELKPEAREVLKNKAEWLRDNPSYSLTIEGHCDDRGTSEYNLALGERRAMAAWKFLNALGISGDRMKTISYGEERPAVQGNNEEAWSQNRRDEFKLSK
jgi:peptidoglycan-associated lipoprotein